MLNMRWIICWAILFYGIVILILIIYSIRIYKRVTELESLKNSSLESLNSALSRRYDVIEGIINYSNGLLSDENGFVVKLLQAKLLPINEKVSVEKELIEKLKRVLSEIYEIEEINNSKELTKLRLLLAKSEKIINEITVSLNDLIREENSIICGLPNSIISKIFGFKKQELYEIEFVTR